MTEQPIHRPIKHLRVLYLASFAYGDGSTSWHRLQAMKKLVSFVQEQDITPPEAIQFNRRLPMRVLRKFFGIQVDGTGLHRSLIRTIQSQPFDILWIDKGIMLKPSIFRAFRKASPKGRIAGYMPDDMENPLNVTRELLQTFPLYDVFFTNRWAQVGELQKPTGPQVYRIGKGFSRDLHRPVELTPALRQELGGEVVFIGSWEKERSDILVEMGKKGIPIKIWGEDSWNKKLTWPVTNLTFTGSSAMGERYVEVINASDICLGFLRKQNRDQHTSRSMEIPACGAFMLAERTDEHLRLFEEGKEAEFFSSQEELLQKIQYYREHPEERKKIAKAGRERCLRSGYSNIDRIRRMLQLTIYGHPERDHLITPPPTPEKD
ncbi:MAG: glycosyltransferase [Myxococcales bacterium]|nr:glycosyltransferase [Myxococcales bacterium]